jgi:hypothetical protein
VELGADLIALELGHGRSSNQRPPRVVGAIPRMGDAKAKQQANRQCAG